PVPAEGAVRGGALAGTVVPGNAAAGVAAAGPAPHAAVAGEPVRLDHQGDLAGLHHRSDRGVLHCHPDQHPGVHAADTDLPDPGVDLFRAVFRPVAPGLPARATPVRTPPAPARRHRTAAHDPARPRLTGLLRVT